MFRLFTTSSVPASKKEIYQRSKCKFSASREQFSMLNVSSREIIARVVHYKEALLQDSPSEEQSLFSLYDPD